MVYFFLKKLIHKDDIKENLEEYVSFKIYGHQYNSRCSLYIYSW